MVLVVEGGGAVDAGEVGSPALVLVNPQLFLDNGVVANLCVSK